MIRAVVVAIMLLWSTVALARFAPQEWPADQSGVDLWSLGHVTTIQIDNMSGVGTRFACTDSTGQLIPSATACVASGAAFYQFVDDPSVGTQPQRGHLGFGESASTLCTNDDAGNDRTNAELCTVAGNPFNVGGSTSLITKVSTNSYGQATLVQAVGLGPSLAQSGGNLIDQSYEYVSRSTNAPVNAVNMGVLASGVNCQTVTTGVAVPRICAAGTDYVASVAVTAPVVNNGTAANPNVGVSLPANQVAYGTGTNVSSSANFVVDTVSFSPDIQVGVAGRIRSGLGTDGGDLLTVAGTVFSGSHQIWKDSTPSAAANEGMSVPGGSVTSDLVYSMYNGSWNERMRLLQLGGLRFPTMAAPSTPASGFSVIYIDSTSLNVAAKNAAGTVNHGLQTVSCGANTWVRAVNDAGLPACTQPAFTDVSGTLACGQLPALTGAFTSSGCATAYAGLPTASQVMVSAGPSVVPLGDSTYTFDRVAHVQAAGNAVGINGVAVSSNASFVAGVTTAADRDRVQFFVGGGSLGATGAGDNTLVDINPSATAIRTGVTGGIYSTERVRSLSYSGAGTSPSELSSLYIDGAPSVGGFISVTTNAALHVAAGQTKLDGNLTCSTLSAGGIVAADTTGTVGIAGAGGLGAAISGQQTYYTSLTAATVITGAKVWFETSSSAASSTTAIEYIHPFAPKFIGVVLNLINNPVTVGTCVIGITRNGAAFGTPFTISNVTGIGYHALGTETVGTPVSGDKWGLYILGTGTTTVGLLAFTATMTASPYVF